MNLSELTQRLHAIRDQNDWQRFHNPKNLAMAASVEMAELVEIFQWLSEDESRRLEPAQLEHVGQEIGDVVSFLKTLTGKQPDFKLPILPPSTDSTPRPRPFD